MNTTVEALQALYVKKGGNLEDVANITTIPDMIDALADIGAGMVVTDDGDGNVTLSIK